ALAQGQAVVETFNYTLKDSANAVSNSTTLTINITGTNDAPIALVDSANVVEAGNNLGVLANNATDNFAGTFSATGNVLTNDTDVDTGNTKTVSAVNGLSANVGAPSIAGTYGTVTIAANGTYTYTLNNTLPATQALTQGQTVTDAFTYTVIDSNGATSTANLNVTVTGTNDRPTLNLNPSSPLDEGFWLTNYTENGAPISIADTDIAITDIDDTNIESAVITLLNPQAGDVMAVGTLPAGITFTQVGNVITLSGSATKADYQLAIRAITFANTSDTPIAGDRLIEVYVNDGQAQSTVVGAVITVVADNDPPVLDLDASAASTGFTTTFNASTGSPVPIGDVDVSVIDPDSNIVSATITLTNLQAGDLFVAGTMPVGIAATIVGNVVTLSGSASVSSYQVAIRAINFDTTSINTTARLINVVVNDGTVNSNIATTTVTILGTIAGVPVLDLDANDSSGATTTAYQGKFTVGATAVAIADTDVLVTDSNSTNMTSATIMLTNAQTGDVLTAGTMPIGITASIVGNVVTLTGSATIAAYQTAIRAITFSNSLGAPVLTDRVFNVVVNDGTTPSNTAVSTISMNRAPTIDLDANNSTTTGNNYITTYTDGAGAVALSDIDIAVVDADGIIMSASITLTNPKTGDMFTVGTLPSGITATVAGNTVSLSGSATPADYQTAIGAISFSNSTGTPDTTPRNITVTVNDGAATSSTAIATINVVDVNSPPVLDLDASAVGTGYSTFYSVVTRPNVAISDTDVSVTDVDSSNITSAAITLTNAQLGDILIAGAMPLGITASVVGNVVTLSGAAFYTDYQAAIRAISFNSSSSDLTARDITVTVTDGTSNSNTAHTTITIIAANTPPVADTVAVTGNEDTLIPVVLHGTDADGTVTNFSLSTLPLNGQLYLDAAMTQLAPTGILLAASGGSLTVYFKPLVDWNGSVNFNYTASDNVGGVSPTATATVTVTPVSDGSPIAVADAYSTTLSASINITKASLLANDTLTDNATITDFTAPTGGTLVDNGTYYTYTAPATAGARTFTYTITDQDGQTSMATVNIGVFGAGDDFAVVQESALVEGAGTKVVTGNLFTNDAGNTSVTSATMTSTNTAIGTANVTSTTTTATTITIVSQIGTLVIDRAGGNYTYTLNNAANNTTSNASVEETFSYVGNSSSAVLHVTVQDDRPVASNIVIEIPEQVLPKYSLVLVLDCSGSMADQVKSVAVDGTVTLTTRMAVQNSAVSALIREYFSQATDVSVKIVAFASTAQIMNAGVAYTNADTAVAAVAGLAAGGNTINGIAIGNLTNYQDGLTKAQTAMGTTIDPTRSNNIYFLSDGDPTGGGAPVATSGYTSYLTLHPEINSYGIAVGSGIVNLTHLDQINNVDILGDGVRDPAIVVADVSKLEDTLLSTVPQGYGGNVISANSASSVNFGADGGYVNQVSLLLDTDSNPLTAEQLVAFNYNIGTNQITWAGGFPTGSPATGNLLTLNASKGFAHGTLVFDFTTGDYTYLTAGLAHEGDSFSLNFVAVDKDGDTSSATQTISIVDGKPVANNDSDTLTALSQFLEGNVITGMGTDGGISATSQLTSFTASASGVDNPADNAQVTSIVFKGNTYNLTVNSTGSSSGGNYAISGGELSWIHASNGSKLIFDENGHYKYTPPTADIPVSSPLPPVAAVLPILTVSNAAVTESATTTYAQFTVSLSAPSATNTTVTLALPGSAGTGTNTATSGTDYSATLQYSTDGGGTWSVAAATPSATIMAGQTSLLARVQIVDNATSEVPENFRLTATRTAGSTANAAATGYAVIIDNDGGSAVTPAVFSINDVTINETAGTATFTITLTGTPGGSVTVSYATSNGSALAGSDYTSTTGTTANFSNTVKTQTITVPITNDAVLEGAEAFFVNLTATSNAGRAIIGDGTGVATITNVGGSLTAPIVILETDPALVPANGITLQGMLSTSSVAGSAPVLYATGATGGAGVTNDQLQNLETLVINFSAATHPQGVQNLKFEVANSGAAEAVTYTFYAIDGHELGQYTVAGNGWTTMPAEFSGVAKVTMLADTGTNVRIHAVQYNDVINTPAATPVAPEIIQYTLTDTDGDTSSASLTLNITTNVFAGDATANTITGTAANDAINGLAGDDNLIGSAGHDIIQGGDGNDTMDGGADNDVLTGGLGIDTIVGGTGNDTLSGNEDNDSLSGGDGLDLLEGGAGNDTLVGSLGADTLLGGAGADTMTGGVGGVDLLSSDTFRWDLTDRGNKGAPTLDTVTDFNPAAAVSGGDVLDLRDLLSSENHLVGTGNLASYLHFEKVGADTKVHISSTGGFNAGYVLNQEDQTILLQGVDLTTGFSTDQQIIQDLLTKQKLITD
ncbi:MAG: type I secretion C-terminal target domain-containing protein, partial [Methylotenera sp.]|nr:type I secretion C-terminal target domain-containing protein [Methylotenera sp.]